MKAIKTILIGLGAVLALTACDDDKNENPTGSWISAAPVSVTESIKDAKSADKLLSFDFVAPAEGATGEVTLTADYDITSAVATDSVAADSKYQVRATIKGTWTQDVDDHEDYLLTFDKNSLKVEGVDAPMLGPVTDEFLNSLAPFTAIEDVEVTKDGSHMSFESKNPDVKYQFVKK